jgi:hypothetical protein
MATSGELTGHQWGINWPLPGSSRWPLTHGSVRVAGVGYAVSLGVRARFRATARIVRGTGRYAAARGSVGLSSVVDRSTWSMVGTVTGTVVL